MEKIRLSHSALKTFNTCERKFQLERLLEGASTREDTSHTVFGKAFGVFISSYLLTQDQDLSIYKAWLEYYPVVEDDAKTEETMILACLASVSSLELLLEDYEVATFNFKPAVELSFRLEVDENCYFVGYVDLVLRSKITGRMAILEVKTTGLAFFDLSPIFQNSGQALGYSICLDQIVGEAQSNYEVIYLVAQVNKKTFGSVKVQVLNFAKTLADRFNWFIALKMDADRLASMLEAQVFPMRGDSCLQFMRACPQFNTCQLHSLDRIRELEVDEIDYQFRFELEEVIDSHISRITQTNN